LIKKTEVPKTPVEKEGDGKGSSPGWRTKKTRGGKAQRKGREGTTSCPGRYELTMRISMRKKMKFGVRRGKIVKTTDKQDQAHAQNKCEKMKDRICLRASCH